MLLKSFTKPLIGILCVSSLFAEVGMGPINPKFVQYQKEKERVHTFGASKIQTSSSSMETGWMPSPMTEEIHKSRQTSQTNTRKLGSSYPAKFDLSDPNLDHDRNDSLLTPVKNQANCGVCWAFAAYGAYEGQTKIDTLGSFDFSEQNLRYTNGTEWSNNDPCSGGNLPMVTAYLVRGDGPVSEHDDPYDLSPGNTYNPDAKAIRYVDNVLELPLRNFQDKTDIDYIKNALYTLKKPLYVSLQVGFGTAGETGKSVWDSDTKSFYCNGQGDICQSNHAVVIVGWDDTYRAQGQTGAFILRNSWGSTWAGDGYFYVPYNDDSIALSGTIAYFEDWKDSQIHANKIYEYDTLPAVLGWGYTDATPMWGANKFTIEHDAVVTAVGFYARGSGTTYEIKLYQTMSGSGETIVFSGQLGSTQSSSSPIKRGWHTVKLNQPVSVVSGQTLIVQVKFSTPNGYSLPIEGDVSGYVDAAYAPGESFWSSDGTNFQDVSDMMTDYIGDPNIAIKVLADEHQVGPVPGHSTLVPVLSYLLF